MHKYLTTSWKPIYRRQQTLIKDISDKLSLIMGTETGVQYSVDKITETAASSTHITITEPTLLP